MDAFHERLARVGLSVLGDFGFALAGGYAVQAHGLVERPSEDVDLFATLAAEESFPDSVRAAVDAYRADGLDVDVVIENRGFARLTVTDPVARRASKVELGVDWRRDPPTHLAIGPVLSRDDAVANKVGALYSRGQARDYIDVDAAITAGGYTRDDLLALAVDHDPGFTRGHFAEALLAVRRLPMTEFTAYGLSAEETRALVARVLEWADDLAREHPTPA